MRLLRIERVHLDVEPGPAVRRVVLRLLPPDDLRVVDPEDAIEDVLDLVGQVPNVRPLRRVDRPPLRGARRLRQEESGHEDDAACPRPLGRVLGADVRDDGAPVAVPPLLELLPASALARDADGLADLHRLRRAAHEERQRRHYRLRPAGFFAFFLTTFPRAFFGGSGAGVATVSAAVASRPGPIASAACAVSAVR